MINTVMAAATGFLSTHCAPDAVLGVAHTAPHFVPHKADTWVISTVQVSKPGPSKAKHLHKTTWPGKGRPGFRPHLTL